MKKLSFFLVMILTLQIFTFHIYADDHGTSICDTTQTNQPSVTAKSAILILTFGAREAVSLWLNLRLSFRSSRIPSIIPGKVCQCEKLNLLLSPNFLNNHGHI